MKSFFRVLFRLSLVALLALPCGFVFAREAPVVKRFSFGSAKTASGYVAVSPADLYTLERGYGFEPAAEGRAPVFFSVTLPEGNYRVTVTLGGGGAASCTTIKAELRRLMLEQVRTAPGETVTRSFVVNIRTPALATGGRVHLNVPRETVDEAVAWDEKLTLEFNGTSPAVNTVVIEAVDVPTVYILGDSTVTDQGSEPYASWGQMLPRFFRPDIAVANHAESGESLGNSTRVGRFAKVLGLMKPGDYLLIQYGHNDMKSKAPDALARYRATLKDWVEKTKQKGGLPILVTSVNRHTFRDGKVINSLRDYPDTVRAVAAEESVPLIDLHLMSKQLYEALGEQGSAKAFKHDDSPRFDHTHHSPYGAYELAKCIVEGIRLNVPGLAAHMAPEVAPYDPAKPSDPEQFGLPPSPGFTSKRPLGD